MALQDVAVVVGLVFGALALSSVCWVWAKDRDFGAGGTVLTFAAVVLMGLSVWSSAQLKFSGGEIEISLEKLRENDGEISKAVIEVSRKQERTREQLIRLADALQEQQTLDPQTAENLRQTLEAQPPLDLDSLRGLANTPEQP